MASQCETLPLLLQVLTQAPDAPRSPGPACSPVPRAAQGSPLGAQPHLGVCLPKAQTDTGPIFTGEETRING